MMYISSLKLGVLTYLEEFLISLSHYSTRICFWGILEEVEIPIEILLEFEEKNK